MRVFLTIIAAVAICCNATASSEEVVLKTATGDIYGTLIVPQGKGKTALAIISAGSGAVDRDGNSAPSMMMGNNLRMLADSLAAYGIASLRYDKRGVAASSKAGLKEEDLKLGTYVDDLRAWAAMYAADVRFSGIVLAGHSEGALLSLAAAQDNADIAAIVHMAGMGRTMDEVLKEQLAGQQLPDVLRGPAFAIIDTLKAGRRYTGMVPDALMSLFRPSVQPFLISCFSYDPCKLIARLAIPVLIVQGTTDIQVSVKDAEMLAAADPGAKKVIVGNMNHMLKYCPSLDVSKQLSVYYDPDLPLDTGFVGACVDFIRTAVR